MIRFSWRVRERAGPLRRVPPGLLSRACGGRLSRDTPIAGALRVASPLGFGRERAREGSTFTHVLPGASLDRRLLVRRLRRKPLMEDQTVWVLRQRYTELGLNLRAAWDTYIRFYTVFLTFSMAALAWIFASDRTLLAVRMVAWTFIAQTFLTSVTSLLISLHSRQVRRDQERIEALLVAVAGRSLPSAPPCISIPMAMWAGGANCLAMTAMGLVWLYVALR